MEKEVTIALPYLIPVKASRVNGPCSVLGARFTPLMMNQSHILVGNVEVEESRQHWRGTFWSSSSWCDQQARTMPIISNA